jgi:hypothetical protein
MGHCAGELEEAFGAAYAEAGVATRATTRAATSETKDMSAAAVRARGVLAAFLLPIFNLR